MNGQDIVCNYYTDQANHTYVMTVSSQLSFGRIRWTIQESMLEATPATTERDIQYLLQSIFLDALRASGNILSLLPEKLKERLPASEATIVW